MSLICGERLVKTYRMGEVDVPAVRGVDFSIAAKSFVAFVGCVPSKRWEKIECLPGSSRKKTAPQPDVSNLRSGTTFRTGS